MPKNIGRSLNIVNNKKARCNVKFLLEIVPRALASLYFIDCPKILDVFIIC